MKDFSPGSKHPDMLDDGSPAYHADGKKPLDHSQDDPLDDTDRYHLVTLVKFDILHRVTVTAASYRRSHSVAAAEVSVALVRALEEITKEVQDARREREAMEAGRPDCERQAQDDR